MLALEALASGRVSLSKGLGKHPWLWLSPCPCPVTDALVDGVPPPAAGLGISIAHIQLGGGYWKKLQPPMRHAQQGASTEPACTGQKGIPKGGSPRTQGAGA